MSIEISNAVWRTSQSVGRARLVLLAIADHQGEIGAWPSIETLAKMVNSSERSVQRDIAELVQLGELIKFEQLAPSRGQYKSNLYWVNLPSVSHLISGVTNSDSGVTELTSGVTDLQSGVTESASGVTTVGVLTLTRTLTEPLLKESKASRISEDWKPSEDLVTWATKSFPAVNWFGETEKFVDYYLAVPGAKGLKKDWSATWRNWIRNSVQFSKAKPRLDKNEKNRETAARFLAKFGQEEKPLAITSDIDWTIE